MTGPATVRPVSSDFWKALGAQVQFPRTVLTGHQCERPLFTRTHASRCPRGYVHSYLSVPKVWIQQHFVTVAALNFILIERHVFHVPQFKVRLAGPCLLPRSGPLRFWRWGPSGCTHSGLKEKEKKKNCSQTVTQRLDFLKVLRFSFPVPPVAGPSRLSANDFYSLQRAKFTGPVFLL